MNRFDGKTTILLTLPALALLFFVSVWSNVTKSSTSFRIVKHEIAWEIESPGGITGIINNMKFEKVFCYRVIVNYPTPFLARYRPGGSQAFLRLRGPKPHALSIKTFCFDAKGIAVPRKQHIEWNHNGEATSETEYTAKTLRATKGPLVFHVQLRWNDGSKPIDLPVTTLSPAALQTSEGFSLDLNSK